MLTEITAVLASQGMLILCLLAIIFTGMLVSISFLRSATDNSYTTIEYFSLGISAWSIPVLLAALPASGLLQISDTVFRVIAVIIFLAALWLIKPMMGKPLKISFMGWLLFILLILSIAANLIFLSRILFPAYFDSVEHYRIIKSLLQSPGLDTVTWPTSSYYHIGYHTMLAAIIKLTGASIIDVMLVAGQLALSTLAIPLFFIISRETKSATAALFTTGLAAFGWYMPAHALNWGKYPALFGFSILLLVFSLIYLIFKDPRSWLDIKKLTLLFVVLAACGIMHTRALVVCGVFASALFLAAQWDRLETKMRRVILGTFVVILFIAGISLRADATFATLLTPYVENDLPSLYLILFLGIFAAWKFPKLTFALLILISMAVICMYIPVSGLLGYPNLYLLDRPYVQILLYIPFSFIGGLGLASLLEVATVWKMEAVLFRRVLQLAAFAFLAVNAIFYQKYYATSCCKLAGTDDLAAFSWIQYELPQDAVLMIASQNLSFTPDTSGFSKAGVDAGLWAAALTEKVAAPFPAGTDFTQPETFVKICARGVDYIYKGNLSGSFNESGLTAKPDWYQMVFHLPEVKIYQVIGCPSV